MGSRREVVFPHRVKGNIKASPNRSWNKLSSMFSIESEFWTDSSQIPHEYILMKSALLLVAHVREFAEIRALLSIEGHSLIEIPRPQITVQWNPFNRTTSGPDHSGPIRRAVPIYELLKIRLNFGFS